MKIIDVNGAKKQGSPNGVATGGLTGFYPNPSLANSSVSGNVIMANTVLAGHIGASTIITANIAANAVTSTEILNSSISGNKIAANSVLTGHLQNSSISGNNIAANSILVGHFGTNMTPTFAGVNLGDENLNDYDEGSWTPVLHSAGAGTRAPAAYSTQIGRYTRIGNKVCAQASITISGTGSLAGTLDFSLPFAAAVLNGPVCLGYQQNLTSSTYFFGMVSTGNSIFNFYRHVSGSNPALHVAADLAGGGDSCAWQYECTYQI